LKNSREEDILIKIERCATPATRNTMKMKTLTGHVAPTGVIGAARCGGVAEKLKRKQRDVSLLVTFTRKKRARRKTKK
jgi:hypothetical protein